MCTPSTSISGGPRPSRNPVAPARGRDGVRGEREGGTEKQRRAGAAPAVIRRNASPPFSPGIRTSRGVMGTATAAASRTAADVRGLTAGSPPRSIAESDVRYRLTSAQQRRIDARRPVRGRHPVAAEVADLGDCTGRPLPDP
jgi:hypothetical protein